MLNDVLTDITLRYIWHVDDFISLYIMLILVYKLK